MKQSDKNKFEKNSLKQSSEKVPCKLSELLQHRLVAYGLSAGAAGVAMLACAVAADAAPVCKHSSTILFGTENFSLNPAEQGIAPFNIAQTFNNVSSLTCCFWNREFLTPNLPGAGELLDANKLPAALSFGASIGPGGQFGPGQSYGLLFSYGPVGGGKKTHHQGNFNFAQENYFGFKFPISGNVHYGWVKLRVKFGPGFDGIATSTYVLEYAYETQPDTAILAGSCTETEDARTPQPASLGALALGAQGISLWRK